MDLEGLRTRVEVGNEPPDRTSVGSAMECLRRLAETAVAMSQAATVTDVLDAATSGARTIVDARLAVTSLTEGESWAQSITSVSVADEYGAWRDYASPTDGSGIYAVVCRENRPMRLTQSELELHPAWRGFGAEAGAHVPLRGWLAVPLIARDGSNIGLIQVSDRADGGDFDEFDEVAAVQLAALASAEVERLRQVEAGYLTTQELARQHDLVTTICENATSALFLMDERGHPTYQNAAAEAMFGYRLEEISDAPLHDAIHHHRPDGSSFPMHECPIDRALPERRWVEPYEDLFIRKDGTFLPVRAAASPIVESGVPVGTVVEVADLTAEREMLAEREFQRSLLEAQGEASVDGLVVVSEARQIAWHNQRFLNLWHLPVDVVAQGDAAALAHASRVVADPDRFMARVEEIYRHRIVAHDELGFADGRTVERYGAPLDGPDGTAYGYFWSFRDITDRKVSEERLTELYRREHELSQRLQAGLLTAASPSVGGHTVSTAYRPGTIAMNVGGDWFDSFARPDGTVALVVGDVVGHDVDAAAAMGQLRGALRALARTAGPAAVLEGMDALLRELGTRRLTTLVYVELEPDTGRFRYSCAGHPPPLLIGSGSRARYLWEGRSTPLGCSEGGAHTEGVGVLAPGDTLVLYSDGLVERRGEVLDVGLRRLEQRAGLVVHDAPGLADSICDELLAGRSHDDDVCVLATHRIDPSGFTARIAAERGALAMVRNQLSRWLANHGVSAPLSSDVVLAVNEAVANSVEHGHHHDARGMVTIRAARHDGELRVSVVDDGTWRSPTASAARGRGLAMMEHLMDHVEVHGDEHGTVVAMAAPAPCQA